MKTMDHIKGFFRRLASPRPSMTYEPTKEQKEEITAAIRKQRFYGDIPGRREYQDDEYRDS